MAKDNRQKETEKKINAIQEIESGLAAAQLAAQRNIPAADIAIDSVRYDPNNAEQYILREQFLRRDPNGQRSEYAIKQAAQGYANFYETLLEKFKVDELATYYQKELTGEFSPLAGILTSDKYKGKTVEDIHKEVADAQHILDTKKYRTQEEVEKAELVIISHERFNSLKQKLTSKKIKAKVREAEDKAEQKDLEQMVQTMN